MAGARAGYSAKNLASKRVEHWVVWLVVLWVLKKAVSTDESMVDSKVL